MYEIALDKLAHDEKDEITWHKCCDLAHEKVAAWMYTTRENTMLRSGRIIAKRNQAYRASRHNDAPGNIKKDEKNRRPPAFLVNSNPLARV